MFSEIRATLSIGPANVVAAIGDQVTLGCAGDAQITYWILSKDGNDSGQLTIAGPGCSIVNNSQVVDHYTVESFEGGTRCNLNIFDITVDQGGVYRCSEGANSLSSIFTVIGKRD